MINSKFAKHGESEDSDNAAWWLVVNSPGRGGRTVSLPETGQMSIGRSISNDIVLRDSSASDIQLMLHLNYPAIQMEVVSGFVDIDGQSYEAGQRMHFNAQVATFGDIEINVENNLTLSSTGSNETSFNDESVSKHLNDATIDANLTGKSASNSANYVWLSVALLLLTLGIWKTFQSVSTESADFEAITRLFLNERQYDSVTLAKDGEVITLNGRVSRQEQLIEIDRFVSDHQAISRGNIVVEELLENAVHDVFRINGIEAEIEFNANNVLVVTTAVPDESLEKVKNILATDLPLLKSLEFINTPPPLPLPQEKPAAVREDVGKRVAMVVSGDPAYVLTQDSTRYFVGSILPSGHRVLRIEEGRVTLALNGEETKLQF